MALYFFTVLAYYVLRPIREELGVAGGVKNLPWLFTGTLIAMTVINPLFAWSVKRWARETFFFADINLWINGITLVSSAF